MSPVILHVEDDPELADTVAIAFNNLGFHGKVLNATTVHEALDIVRKRRELQQRLDLLIVDMNLPDGTGRDVVRAVKSNPNWASIPILVLSNETNNKTVAESYALGANCFFPKLSHDKSILEAIEALYGCWFDSALLPPPNQSNAPSEILGRTISLKAQTSQFHTELARLFSDNARQSRLWLDFALNESNHANLLAFFLHIDSLDLTAEAVDTLKKYVGARESDFRAAQRSLATNKHPTMETALHWALSIERTFEPEILAVAIGNLFPNSPAATMALTESTVNHLLELVEVALTETSDPQVHEEARALEQGVEKLRGRLTKVH